MKIICIGKNYLEHIRELGSEIPEKPVFFCKPDTALLLRGRPFFLPDFSNEIHYETELVIKICKVGKNIEERFAHTYYEEVGIGLDLTARDLQREYSAKGLPWEICKSFDSSAVIGNFVHKSKIENIDSAMFYLVKNGKIVQKGDTSDMLFKVDEIIGYVSQFMTLKIGDLIFTGTPSGVGPLKIGDRLEAFLGDIDGGDGVMLLRCNIK